MGQKTRKQLEIEKVTSALYSQGTRQTVSSEQQRNTAKQSAIRNFTQSINSQAAAWSKHHIQSTPKSRDVRSYNPSGTPALQKPKTESTNVETVNFTSRKPGETSRGGQSWKERQERLTGKQTAYQMQKESGIVPGKKQEEEPERPSFSASYQEKEDWFNQKIGQAVKKEEEPKEENPLSMSYWEGRVNSALEQTDCRLTCHGRVQMVVVCVRRVMRNNYIGLGTRNCLFDELHKLNMVDIVHPDIRETAFILMTDSEHGGTLVQIAVEFLIACAKGSRLRMRTHNAQIDVVTLLC